ncbi:tRNA pseudouridine(38-40) synthase TruA [Saccharospirillum sp. HFRX-1]|uniref:tRNA pseudouridine(38-40) synthase TruA n=1 Tax=unclassified Saccharospirillum TaxID=2633430 RepID=UPI00371D0B9A
MSEIFPFLNTDHRYRVAMGVEYRGTDYYGWQIQKTGVPTVQGALTEAISSVANHPVDLIVAGRTDAGVHASNQVIHFDTFSVRKEYGWTVGTNTRLPRDISVQWAKIVDTHFHARFAARERAYRFVVYNAPIPSGILRDGMTWERQPLDIERMQQAAQLLIGEHDFSAFRASECQAKSPVKEVRELTLVQQGRLIVLQARANGFLHHMVRNIMGVLLAIGRGDKPVEWAQQVLETRDRNQGGVTAPGAGLYFVRANYDRDDLPRPEAGPAFLDGFPGLDPV